MANYIFDLYGTLIDIHTNEANAFLWKKLAMVFSMMGAEYMPKELKKQYQKLAAEECQRKLLWAKERFRDDQITENEIEIQLEKVFYRLLSDKGAEVDEKQMNQIGILFRSLSTSYSRLYEGVQELLQRLKESGNKIYLLSNAQRIFTEPEMRMFGIYGSFDGILYSSDAGIKKPSFHFYDMLFQKFGLEKEESVMIGNEYKADVLGAAEYGIRSMYIFTAQSGERPASLPDGCRKIEKITDVFPA